MDSFTPTDLLGGHVKAQQNPGGTLLAEQKWAVYRLAADHLIYGDDAGKHIITTEDFESEIDGPVFEDIDINNEVALGFTATVEQRRCKWTCSNGHTNVGHFLPGQRSFLALCGCGARTWQRRADLSDAEHIVAEHNAEVERATMQADGVK